MKNFSPNYFFELKEFQHADLFASCRFVWEALAQIELFLSHADLGKIDVLIPPGVFLINPEKISIGKGTVVEPGAYIKGPCIIGENCTIRHAAYIRGNFITGNSCVVGHGTEVKNTIFLNKACAAHFSYLGDCILGNYTNLGAGTKCANLKLDKSEIIARYMGEEIKTGRKKIGAMVGDFSSLGCNSVMNPGTFLGKNVFCYPGVNCGGFIAENQIVKTKNEIVIKKTGKENDCY